MIQSLSSNEKKTVVENHFGFHELPFGVAPDPRFFYGNYHYAEGLDVLAEGIQAKKGLMLVTGEVGTGKTILLRKLTRHLEASTRFVFLSTNHLTSEGLTELILEDLGLTSEGKTPLARAQALKEYLLEHNRAGRTVALLIDEAQKLADEALENLCDLSNLETAQEKLLQIVLVGQPELAVKLSKPGLQRIKQRIALHHQTRPLSVISDAEHYIRHRLQSAGYQGPEIFNREALHAIWCYSSGTPRLINTLCDNALAVASRAGRKRISAYIIIKVAAKLMLERRIHDPMNALPENRAGRITDAPKSTRRSRQNKAKIPPRNPAAETIRHLVNERVNQLTALDGDGKDCTIMPQFFDFMARAAAEGIGPMAKLIVGDQISDLGESRDSFPQEKLAELIERVSGEIFNETMRARFKDTMAQAVSALQSMRTL
jgi:type II secretory pathway predicted ATPase ExeA